MAGETYAAPGTVVGQTAYADWGERVHESIVIGGKRKYIWLGGSDQVGSISTSYERAVAAPEVELCIEEYRGLTVDLIVWVRAEGGGTVRMRLYNTDDSSAVAEMAAAVSDTGLTRYIVESITLPAGTSLKWCQLQIKSSSATAPVFGFGHLRIHL